ncbi:MAG: uracil-DNA glycosylase [Robiginitomaculum sp.]|nr:uracil-DNA glycosylase [Robiginitomaculum sp.]
MEYKPESLNKDYKINMLHKPHIVSLTRFVDELKKELGSEVGMPYFDPLDGGINAKLLWVLETPGPKAVGTNFISRDNPDPTARNTLKILADAGIKREDTVLWNVVPWNLSSEEKNQNPKITEIRRGIPYLLRLIQLLSNLKAVILCGNPAKRAAQNIRMSTSLRVFETYHPAGQSYNQPKCKDHIHTTIANVATFLSES